MSIRPRQTGRYRNQQYGTARRVDIPWSTVLTGFCLLLVVTALGAAQCLLRFQTSDFRLQQAQLQLQARQLEQERIRLQHAVEQMADVERLRIIARDRMGLIESQPQREAVLQAAALPYPKAAEPLRLPEEGSARDGRIVSIARSVLTVAESGAVAATVFSKGGAE